MTQAAYESNHHSVRPLDWDVWIGDLADAVLKKEMPELTHIFWSPVGSWFNYGVKSSDVRAIKGILTGLHSAVSKNGGQILYKTTTAGHLKRFEVKEPRFLNMDAAGRRAVQSLQQKEQEQRQQGQQPENEHQTANSPNQVSLYDAAAITKEFYQLGKENERFHEVYWDAVHFHPFVYEELNHVLLNQLC